MVYCILCDSSCNGSDWSPSTGATLAHTLLNYQHDPYQWVKDSRICAVEWPRSYIGLLTLDPQPSYRMVRGRLYVGTVTVYAAKRTSAYSIFFELEGSCALGPSVCSLREEQVHVPPGATG